MTTSLRFQSADRLSKGAKIEFFEFGEGGASRAPD
jgi:hypothetical protein